MKNLYGQLDLTRIGEIAKAHPELVKEVQFKDGVHKLLNVNVRYRAQAGQYGNVAYINAAVKKDAQKEGVNYYIADLKESNYESNPSTENATQNDAPFSQTSDLPFD
jgi:hypothetical protein